MSSNNDKPPPRIMFQKVDPDTGEETPYTAEEHDAELKNIRQAIKEGKFVLSDKAAQDLADMGMTPEEIESLLSEKDS